MENIECGFKYLNFNLNFLTMQHSLCKNLPITVGLVVIVVLVGVVEVVVGVVIVVGVVVAGVVVGVVVAVDSADVVPYVYYRFLGVCLLIL